MDWITVNERYLDYLREKEKRIPYSDYGTDGFKPFFGTLFEKDELVYITQISHAQQRHHNLKQAIDFRKIYDPVVRGRLIAVVNLNYMFPIPKEEISILKNKNIDKCRTFTDEAEKSKYIKLLRLELNEINKMNLSEDAQKIYKDKYDFPDSVVSKRCLDYKKLECFAKQWKTDN